MQHRPLATRRTWLVLGSAAALLAAVLVVVLVEFSGSSTVAGGPRATETSAPSDSNDPSFVCVLEVADEIRLQLDSAFEGGPHATDVLANSPQESALEQALAQVSSPTDNIEIRAAEAACMQNGDPLLASDSVQELIQLAASHSESGIVSDLQGIHHYSPNAAASLPAAPSESAAAITGLATSTPGVSAPSGGTPLYVDGADGNEYDLTIWAQDRITNCADHAYGPPMISFLKAHPCKDSHRLLATVALGNGRTAALSIITVLFSGTTGDTYGYATSQRFQTLESAAGTGSMNDLLREGRRIPHAAAAIPAREAFTVTGQDASAVVFDAWWIKGGTEDQEPDLVALEQALFLTQATPFD